MKKILFLTGKYDQRGGIYSMFTLMNELRAKGYSVALIIGNHGNASPMEHEFDIQPYYIKSYNWVIPLNDSRKFLKRVKEQVKKAFNLLSEIRIYRYIKSYKPDIVIMNSSDQYVGIKACNRLGIPVIMYFREYMTYDHGLCYWSEGMAKKYFAKLDGGIAISRDVQKYFSRYPIQNLKVIYNGVDPKKYEIVSKKPEDGIFNISCIGSVCEGKNQKLAVMAARLLVESGYHNFHINFYGGDQNDYADKLKEYVQQQKLESYITFEGMVNNVEKLYGTAHLNLLCSKREAFGRVVIEGMLNHCLSIVPDQGGASEIIEKNYNGLVFKHDDEQSLCQVLAYAMDNYEKLGDVIERGYQDAKEKYSSEVNARNFEEYLNETCKKSKSQR